MSTGLVTLRNELCDKVIMYLLYILYQVFGSDVEILKVKTCRFNPLAPEFSFKY
jgi:hypothetical protein